MCSCPANSGLEIMVLTQSFEYLVHLGKVLLEGDGLAWLGRG